ncbi:hypothetical protein DSF06_21010 [Salmonella enterica subsp. enterica]|nr:hypothetical protein [Salmonella enterica subsp. enterica serovar Veneziana]
MTFVKKLIPCFFKMIFKFLLIWKFFICNYQNQLVILQALKHTVQQVNVPPPGVKRMREK